tara:strand:+ start:1971 stop:2204 length:234 start_codon:yes stop_codon:yes gene_type:complete
MKLKTQINNLDKMFLKISKDLHINVKQQETIDTIINFLNKIKDLDRETHPFKDSLSKDYINGRKILAKQLLDLLNKQ